MPPKPLKMAQNLGQEPPILGSQPLEKAKNRPEMPPKHLKMAQNRPK